MLRYFILTSIASFFSWSLAAQELFMPRDVQKAFKKGTRSPDGKPGGKYWQNYGRYNITITALPPDRIIRGKETITYINHSPDTLKNVNFKLFLNIHKPGAPRNGGVSPNYLTAGVQVDDFKINGQKARWPSFQFTNQQIQLAKPLIPHDSVQFSFEWHYEISLESGREGMIDSTTWFLAYFYPRVAVYDDYNGWDMINFMDSHEFYSDFNDYTLTVNVPKNFIVWATGTLQEPQKLLQPAILKRFTESLTSDEVIRVVTKEDLVTKNVTTQNATNSWTFKANKIADMAVGLSDHYVWDATSVTVDAVSQRRAGAQAAYNDTAADYHHMARFAKHALKWFSQKWPGVPYPYEKTTVFQGYAGMEYPMMANDETYKDTAFSKFVAEHEIAHTYMPFYMGINETRYGFMDEGWATTFELLIGYEDLGKERAEEFFKQFRVQGWTRNNSSHLQIPVITPGDALTGPGFGSNMYGKAALGYLALKDLLGDELFKKCLRAFMERWNGKHPIPWDMFNTFNNVSGKNLNWFWNNWFFSNSYIDFEVSEVKKSPAGFTIAVKNTGGFFAPSDILIKYKDGTSETKHISPAVWEKNAKQTTVTIPTKKLISSVQIAGGIFMDADESNNIKMSGDKKGF